MKPDAHGPVRRPCLKPALLCEAGLAKTCELSHPWHESDRQIPPCDWSYRTARFRRHSHLGRCWPCFRRNSGTARKTGFHDPEPSFNPSFAAGKVSESAENWETGVSVAEIEGIGLILVAKIARLLDFFPPRSDKRRMFLLASGWESAPQRDL